MTDDNTSIAPSSTASSEQTRRENSLVATEHRLTKWTQPRAVFWLSFALLAAVHLGLAFNSPWFWKPPKPTGDGPIYENIAFHLWVGDGFFFDNTNPQWRQLYEQSSPDDRQDYASHLQASPQTMASTGRPPLQPMVLASIYTLAGRNENSFAAFRVISALCLALSSAISASLAAMYLNCRFASRRSLPDSGPRLRQWQTLSPVLAVAAVVGLAASNRTLQDYTTDLLTEPLALALLQSFVALTVVMSTRRTVKWPWLVGTGLLLGLLILCRSIFVLWLPGIALLLLLSGKGSWWESGRRSIAILATAFVVCVPWWIHNVTVLNTWMPLGTQGPITLLGGYSDQSLEHGGEWQHEPELELRSEFATRSPASETLNHTEREVQLAREAGRRVKTWISQHMPDLPYLFASRIATHWNPYHGRSLLWKALILLGAINVARHFLVHKSALSISSAPSPRGRTPENSALKKSDLSNKRVPEKSDSNPSDSTPSDSKNDLHVTHELDASMSQDAATVVERAHRVSRAAAVWWLGIPLLSTIVAMLLYTVGGRFLVPVYGILYTLSGIGVATLWDGLCRFAGGRRA